MAKAPPGFTFYPNDFIGGTHHLTAAQVGVYFRLLCYQWANGYLPVSEAKRMAVCGVGIAEWKEAWPAISDKFEYVETSRFYGDETSRLSGGNLEVLRNGENAPEVAQVLVNLRMFEDRERAISAWRKRIQGGNLGGRPKAKTSRLCAVITSTEKGKGKREKGKGKKTKTESLLGISLLVEQVVAHYRTYHARSRAGEKERKLIEQRLKDNYSVDDLKLAIDGNHVSPWHCGENGSGAEYHALELIFRDASHVHDFIEAWNNREKPVLSEQTKRTGRAVEAFVNRDLSLWSNPNENNSEP